MPTRNINLTVEQDSFVETVVQSGRYQNASEAMRDAVRGLQQRLAVDDLTLGTLRAQLQQGIDALERGSFTELGDDELDTGIDRLAADSAR
jgi:antitoxin ParD1/3/4